MQLAVERINAIGVRRPKNPTKTTDVLVTSAKFMRAKEIAKCESSGVYGVGKNNNTIDPKYVYQTMSKVVNGRKVEMRNKRIARELLIEDLREVGIKYSPQYLEELVLRSINTKAKYKNDFLAGPQLPKIDSKRLATKVKETRINYNGGEEYDMVQLRALARTHVPTPQLPVPDSELCETVATVPRRQVVLLPTPERALFEETPTIPRRAAVLKPAANRSVPKTGTSLLTEFLGENAQIKWETPKKEVGLKARITQMIELVKDTLRLNFGLFAKKESPVRKEPTTYCSSLAAFVEKAKKLDQSAMEIPNIKEVKAPERDEIPLGSTARFAGNNRYANFTVVEKPKGRFESLFN